MNESTLRMLLVGVAVGVAVIFLTRKAAANLAAPDVGPSITSSGGIVGALRDVTLGKAVGDQIVKDQVATLPLGGGATSPQPVPLIVESPSDYISGGITDPRSGTVAHRALFGSTVRFAVEINNAGPGPWTGPLRLEVHEDYVFKDEVGTFEQIVTVPARSTRRFPLDYRLAAASVLGNIRPPNLSAQAFAGNRHLGGVKVSVV